MKNPFKLSSGKMTPLHKLKDALIAYDKEPLVGVTQGGSSRKNRGAKQGATTDVEKANNPNLPANLPANIQQG